MSDPRKGVRRNLSPMRRLVTEFVRHGRKVPSIPVARVVDLRPLIAAREDVPHAPTWTVLFMRAYGIVARTHPQLRRAWIPWPYPHLYEHPASECAILIEREWEGETVVFGAKVREPEVKSLTAIGRELRHYQHAPVRDIGYYRQALRVGRLPWPLLRFTFWQSLYLSGYKRAKRFGTFMMSSLGSLGAEQCHPLSPLTTYLTFGPISRAGSSVVKIIYDHRVLDGRCAARCLNDLEWVLHTDLLAELRNLRRAAPQADPTPAAPSPSGK